MVASEVFKGSVKFVHVSCHKLPISERKYCGSRIEGGNRKY